MEAGCPHPSSNAAGLPHSLLSETQGSSVRFHSFLILLHSLFFFLSLISQNGCFSVLQDRNLAIVQPSWLHCSRYGDSNLVPASLWRLEEMRNDILIYFQWSYSKQKSLGILPQGEVSQNWKGYSSTQAGDCMYQSSRIFKVLVLKLT